MRPRLLDLFCKAGGTSMGYHMAGFDVVGVDIEPQPNYPFEFIRWDVMMLNPRRIARRFDAVAASPPCQAYSNTRTLHSAEYADLVGPVRELLERTGLPYVIENVQGAPLLDPIRLCGSSFGLRVRRHRLFESNIELDAPACEHKWQDRHKVYDVIEYHNGPQPRKTGVVSVHGNGWTARPGQPIQTTWAIAMGIDWMSKSELAEAIPPAYTLHIGKQLIEEARS